MEAFPRYWPFVRGINRWPVNSPHKGQWRRALMFSLICAWINGWVSNREAGDLRRHRTHYDATVIWWYFWHDDLVLHFGCWSVPGKASSATPESHFVQPHPHHPWLLVIYTLVLECMPAHQSYDFVPNIPDCRYHPKIDTTPPPPPPPRLVSDFHITLRSRQNGHFFADDSLKSISLHWNHFIFIQT